MICDFCFRHCDIQDGHEGFCHVRKVRNGRLISSGYSYLEALNIDPIEKKPLYHFLPGSKTLSVAQSGCNFNCDFCQNWSLSQEEKGSRYSYVPPRKLVDLALKSQVPSISFTYSEPIVWQDYVFDVSLLAQAHGIKTIMVTNGSFSQEALERLQPFIDAFNIDLKGDAAYYRTVCKGEIQPVLDSIGYLVSQGNHVEVTTMLIEGMHDASVIAQLGSALHEKGVQVWHLSRFFPNYKMANRTMTSEDFLSAMVRVAKGSGIPFIYRGNTVEDDPTICPHCGRILMTSHSYDNHAREESRQHLHQGRCEYCHTKIYGFYE